MTARKSAELGIQFSDTFESEIERHVFGIHKEYGVDIIPVGLIPATERKLVPDFYTASIGWFSIGGWFGPGASSMKLERLLSSGIVETIRQVVKTNPAFKVFKFGALEPIPNGKQYDFTIIKPFGFVVKSYESKVTLNISYTMRAQINGGIQP